jgi:hypothetical protein
MRRKHAINTFNVTVVTVSNGKGNKFDNFDER